MLMMKYFGNRNGQTKGQWKNIDVLYMDCMLLRNVYIEIEIWS